MFLDLSGWIFGVLKWHALHNIEHVVTMVTYIGASDAILGATARSERDVVMKY